MTDPSDPHDRDNSLDAINLVFENPGDSTVRPPRPILLKLGQEARECIERYQRDAKQREQDGSAKSES
jgi:hypothetical protein